MFPFILVAGTLLLLIVWSVYLPFYHEKTIHLTPDESKCFAPECKTFVKARSNDRAILFIHGFPTTPCMYKEVAPYAFDLGYDVYAPLIPTFGADYKDFAKTNFSSWFAFIDDYYMTLRKQYKYLYIVGVSMGGAMTLKLAERYSNTKDAPNAIATVAAPVTYNSFWRDGIVTSPIAYLGRLIAPVVHYIHPAICTHIDGRNDGAEDWHGYKGVFPRQGISLIYNLKAVRKNLSKIKIPLIGIHDKADQTIPYKNLKIIEHSVKTESRFISTKMDRRSINNHHALLSYPSTLYVLMDEISAFFSNH